MDIVFIYTSVYTDIEVIKIETAKIFTSGGSQAVRLPKSCRFNCNEVAVKKIGAMVVLYVKEDALQNFLISGPLTDDVYESILDARREDAEHDAAHSGDREKLL